MFVGSYSVFELFIVVIKKCFCVNHDYQSPCMFRCGTSLRNNLAILQAFDRQEEFYSKSWCCILSILEDNLKNKEEPIGSTNSTTFI